MPSESDGRNASPPDFTTSNSPQGGNNGGGSERRRRQRGKRNNRSQSTKSEPPPNAALKSHYFDFQGQDWQQPPFLDVVKAVTEYFAGERSSATEYVIVGLTGEFALPSITEPADPSDPDNRVLFAKWEGEYKDFKRKQKDREANEGAFFGLLMRQCTEQFQNAAQEHHEWNKVQSNMDTMGLLRIFQHLTATGGATNVDPAMSKYQAQQRFYSCIQGSKMTNAEYYSRFMHHVNVVKYCKGALGASIAALEDACREAKVNSTLDEMKKLEAKVMEREMAMAFLMGADKKRYGNLIAQATNARLLHNGASTFPTTMAGALELLNNGQQLQITQSVVRTSDVGGGASFFTEGQPSDQNGAGRRENPRRNGTGGRGNGGRGGRGGRGRFERNQPEDHQDDQAHINNNDADTDNNNTGSGEYLNPLDNIADPSNDAEALIASDAIDEDVTATELLFLQSDNMHAQLILKRHPTSGLPVTWLILDTGSTANIFCNGSLLRKIHKVKKGLRVRCNAGVVELNMKGFFGDYPEAVWFNPKGIANIFSFHNMNKHCNITYDNAATDRFIVDFKNEKIEFLPTDKGLYHMDLKDQLNSAWNFFETVKGQKAKHTKASVIRAAKARHIQNIIGRPGDRRFTDIVNNNLLRDCPVTSEDIKTATNIYGPNLGSLKGKTTSTTDGHVRTEIGAIPPHIKEHYSDITLAIDILFVNKMPFLVTISRHIKFGTVERLHNRQIPTIKRALQKVIALYSRRNFKVISILGDPEFEPLEQEFPNIQVDCCGADEHEPTIERFIRTIKDRVRSNYNMLPFRRIPKLILEYLIRNAVFWLNAFPALDGVSNNLSPRYIVTGRQVTMKHHVRTEFGAYVQTHEEHSNDMRSRTLGAICLGPTGAAQGSHYFMSVATGKRISRQHWTTLPMPTEVIDEVSQKGQQQGMPLTLTFADRHGRELIDDDDDIDDDHDSTYSYSSASDSEDDLSYDNDSHSDSDVSDDSDPGSDADYDDDSDDDDETTGNDDADEAPPTGQPPATAGLPAGVIQPPHQMAVEPQQHQLQQHQPQFPDENAGNTGVGGANNNNTGNTGVGGANTGVDAGNTGVGGENAGVESEDEEDEEARAQAAADADLNDRIDALAEEVQRDIQQREQLLPNNQQQIEVEMDAAYGPRNHGRNLRPRKRPTTHGDHQVMIHVPHRDEPVPAYQEMIALFNHEVSFLTEQMSAKKGLKVFGDKGAEAVVAEMHQIHYRNVLSPKFAHELTKQQRRDALRYLMFLKEKRCGKIKARGCADGRSQRLYTPKEDASAPTVRTESFIITCAIDAKEGRKVMTIDIPGAFMQADIDDVVHVKFEGEIANLLTKVDPSLYTKYVAYEGKKPVIYAQLNKNLYGTLKGAIQWWKNLSEFLINELGYEANPYDSCVVNKTINGKQCTIIWHVDDLKISHVEQEVLDDLADKLSERYGKEAPLTIQRGEVHEYLGVTIDFSEKGKVKFSMDDYVDRLLEEAPEDMKGVATSPAANHLFQVKDKPTLLDDKKAELYHHLTAKLLYLCKRVRGDIMTAVAFLTTRVSRPDEDDYAKLARCIKYLRATKYMPLTIELGDEFIMQWWVDASFAVHNDMKSHTGAVLTMGKGAIIAISTKQKINTDSSTVAELVGVHDALPMIMWSRYFIASQGHTVVDNVIHQDNQSAILLEKNGRKSCGRKTRALDVRYFSITDKVAQKLMTIKHCPTAEMLGDFLTKPLQGALFRKFRDLIMNYSGQSN
ncbi:unnamed protein product [Cylindrotheca closterium]|uniref:Reverse transcriptase Ty1/copia-type domain-containing protein n=1 Tax=Cylindrotheca closterium TaxID=2856 RepID=A0AAD2FRK5_9STRA|nr:unnamed protein product [Cylindrotheca closterium]CAJ1960658.1 unnamed protein product [Cylindrotheca closterium]CAJ1963885.1 unnamed protein product [Cylindrotheca closterium]